MQNLEISFENGFLGDSQLKVIVWLSRCTSLLSLAGSSLIIYIILYDLRRKLSRANNRLILAMSTCDILNSSALIFSTAPIPRDTGIYGAIGNQATCTTQGFFINFGLSVPMYSASLSLFYLFSIRYNITNEDLLSRKYDMMAHFVNLFIPLALSIISAAFKNFNTKGLFCWLEASPYGCDDGRIDAECTRGKYSSYFETISLAVVLGYCFATTCISMGLIYHSVLRRQKLLQNREGVPGDRIILSRIVLEKKETAKQAALFVGSFLITFLFALINVFVPLRARTVKYVFGILQGAFLPLQGFWNALAYLRPIINAIRRENSEKSCFWVIEQVLCPIRRPSSLQMRNQAILRNQSHLQYRRSIDVDVVEIHSSNDYSTITHDQPGFTEDSVERKEVDK
mmetsp:Transcript_11172/g.15727  ORF Transcript_11172/g.15727 Transcript_11172/m.15727 type:complete len:398 (+) Transcript_11172:133-1326(+)